jgi:NADH-quinone oxidoreductase subunit A
MFIYNIEYIINHYSKILLFLGFTIILSVVILLLSYLLIKQKYDNEKLSVYECGFTPFEDSRTQFDIKFYLVSILFIIFDLEVSFLFPLITAMNENDRLCY